MTTWNRVSGDIGDTVIAYLYGAQTFVGATVVDHVWKNGTAKTDLAATVVDGFDPDGVACGVCTVQLGNSSGWLKTAAVARWYLEHDVTFGDGSSITWPGTAPDIIDVRAHGA